MTGPTRRAVLIGAAALALGACSGTAPTRQDEPVETLRYGDDPAQLLELSRPAGTSRGVVVVVHGGFWQAQYDLGLGRPLAASLAQHGWTAANLEYRRLGNGGGWPETFDDVSAGIDALGDVDGLDLSRVVTLGHSAGGHLAVWAAGRQAHERWRDARVAVTAAVSQAGVLDLGTALTAHVGGSTVRQLIGETTPGRLALCDPIEQVPLAVPVRCVHGTDDDVVPLAQSRTYVEAASAAGGDATLTEVAGDHFTLIDPASQAWRRTLDLLDAL